MDEPGLIGAMPRQSEAAGPNLAELDRVGLIREYWRLQEEHVRAHQAGAVFSQLELIRERQREVKRHYVEALPVVTLSCCPFTAEKVAHPFDRSGLDGFLWQDALRYDIPDPPSPPTLRLLQGALHLNGLPPRGGSRDAHVGPEVPFVIPRILDMPGMIAVVSAIQLECGYTAFPIAYFSLTDPPPGAMTCSWLRSSYAFTDEEGVYTGRGFDEVLDFDLRPWVEGNKLKWINPDDGSYQVRGLFWEKYPWKDLHGREELQTIRQDRLKTRHANR